MILFLFLFQLIGLKLFLRPYQFILLIVFAFNGATGLGQNQENVVKTAYLGKFATYINWPNNDAGADEVFRIVVAGDQDLCNLIKDAFSKRSIKGLEIDVICMNKVSYVPEIDLFMLGSNKYRDLEEAMKLCKNDSFLLVTGSESFGQRGSHINFFLTAEQTLHFEMNKKRLDQDGFKVDFLLLDYAKVLN